MGVREVEDFLSHLAIGLVVSASTQNQAHYKKLGAMLRGIIVLLHTSNFFHCCDITNQFYSGISRAEILYVQVWDDIFEKGSTYCTDPNLKAE